MRVPKALRRSCRQLLPSVAALCVFTALCGLVYPLLVTAVAQTFFGDKTDGSLVHRDGRAVGSALIGQPFEGAGYFHPRPSAAVTGPLDARGYDAMASAGSNLGPRNHALVHAVSSRAAAYRKENGLAVDAAVPVDAVTASASGLDPHISVANARLQVGRVAHARGLSPDVLGRVIAAATQRRPLGVLGDEGVNVLLANLAVDRLASGGGAMASTAR